ncbi:MAG: hypothetical protein ACD_68C00100G0001 [uncultured bacterium]|nr:MAG: hypothetical protein ACD_68C00100G0001 [uncultured bacterium]
MSNRQKVFIDDAKKPATLEGFQDMFNQIYPAEKRTLEHAGIHLAEELGEFSESLLTYRGGRKDDDFDNVKLEAADLYSCYMSVFNSLELSSAKELAKIFSHNCHQCNKAPCECSFTTITLYKS